MPRPILVRGGRIVDPAGGVDRTADLLLQDGKVEAMGQNLGHPDGVVVIEAAGKVVSPGLIDLHVHLREPGQEDLETVATGAMAAAAGDSGAATAAAGELDRFGSSSGADVAYGLRLAFTRH